MEYQCDHCGMAVKGLTCGKCDSELHHRTMQDAQGKQIQVAECPNHCGKIKSPTCCGHDMEATA